MSKKAVSKKDNNEFIFYNRDSFRDIVFEEWKNKFVKQVKKLIKEKYGLKSPKLITSKTETPWIEYNLFTGYKHKFYYDSDPVVSATKYFQKYL